MAFYTYSNGRHEPCTFRNGTSHGTPEDVFEVGAAYLRILEMTTVTVNFIGVVAPGLPRQMLVPLGEEATVREVLDEVVKRGGEGLRRSIWAEDGRIEASVLVAVDGVTVDASRLDARLAPSGGVAEVSVFLVRPIFGG